MMTACEGCKGPQALQASDERLLAEEQCLYAEGDAIYQEHGDDDPRLAGVRNKIAVIETAREHASELACLPDEGCARDEHLQRTLQYLATRSQVST